MKKLIQKASAFFLSLALVVSCCQPALAIADQNVVTTPGTEGFVSLGKYAEKTSIPNVYKITDWIDPPKVENTTVTVIPGKQQPVYVAIILDYSGSMGANDVWDSTGIYTGTGFPNYTTPGAPGTITRFRALEAGVAAAIQSLIDDGNPYIYINISEHGGNRNAFDISNALNGQLGPLTPGNPTGMPTALDNLCTGNQKFVSLYDASGNVRPELDPSNPSFVMWDWGNGANGWTGWYNMNDFAVPFKRILGYFKDGLVSGDIPSDSARYILAMGDGDDWGADSQMITPSSAAWATALKAPLDTNFKPGGSTTAAKTIMNADGGIGATIWGVTVGADTGHNVNYGTDILLPTAGRATQWGMVGWNIYEPHMIGNTWKIPDSIKDSIPTVTTAVANNSDSVIDLYGSWYGALGVTNARNDMYYIHSRFLDLPNGVQLGTSLIDGFAEFGSAAASAAIREEDTTVIETNGNDVTVIDRLNSDVFSYYQMPGEPMINLYTEDPAALSTPSDIDQKAEMVSNNQITWTLKKFNSGYRYMMSYYVKCNVELDEEYSYPYCLETYVKYTDDQNKLVIKNFPMIYLSGAEQTISPITNTSVKSGTAGENGSSTGILSSRLVTGNNSMIISGGSSGNQTSEIDSNGNSIYSLSASGSNSSSSFSVTGSQGGGGIILSAANTQPYKASVPNTATNKKTTGTNSTKGKQATKIVEKIDETATKKEKGKTIIMTASGVPVYIAPSTDEQIILYLAKGKQFKIAGVTKNFYMIQYKKKDGKVYKGYVLKKDVKVGTTK